MELGERELEKIGKYVQSHLEEWSRGKVVEYRPVRDPDLFERIVRVEEGLKNQRELMQQGFQQMDKRFSHLQWTMGIGFTVLAALLGVFNFF